ncbi:DIS3-like exonuclease 2 [Chrysoperla carnea]|uniref:DIS3-like exonuclease 2 n=1 Tax=Chrysoperla carnea TaxID=189513 RepID=UPI001D06B9E4|nr:DIS3-like exonuclease 2 [Chrysoperla carnea]
MDTQSESIPNLIEQNKSESIPNLIEQNKSEKNEAIKKKRRRRRRKKSGVSEADDDVSQDICEELSKLTVDSTDNNTSSSSIHKLGNLLSLAEIEQKLLLNNFNQNSSSKSKPSSSSKSKYTENNRKRNNINPVNEYFKYDNFNKSMPSTSKSPNKKGHKNFRKDENGIKPRSPKKSQSEENGEKEGTNFEEYMSAKDVEIGLKNGTLFEGSIRINTRNFKESYVTNPIRKDPDILIEGLRDRNRALEGDVVVIQLKPKDDWRQNNQKTGKVVFIKEYVHTRHSIGYLKLMPDKNHTFAAFSPRDSRIPRIRIPYTDWPPSFYHEPEKYEKTLFVAKITTWTDTRYALGNIIETVGQAGDLKIETRAILLENGLDVTPYDPSMNQYFPATSEIPAEEYTYREDLRKDCVFTIDPLTARDLDDAVSCKELENGNLEIGVHISDVSFYLKEKTPLDEIVSQKATSIYLVESVYHMLPRELCMLCSLLPNEDKLAFSVFWEITPEGKILNFRFARTIVNSCCQLAYEHVQKMLDTPNEVKIEELPTIYGNHSYEQIIKIVNKLHKIALSLRSNRFENGALRINQPKLMFQLDQQSGLPGSFSIYVNQESHRLIEEFMLLANITVATKINNEYPDLAFLRCHPPPHGHLMENLKKNFEKIGIHLDTSTAGQLHQSMEKYDGDDLISQARMTVINAFCAKPMARAKYFCAAFANDVSDYWHYALNVPFYTHFTSPIRRYADVMVHRLLSALVGYSEKPNWDTDDVQESAAVCNKQKYNAKRAGEQSSELYLTKYIEMNQPVREYAVVLDVKDKSFDVVIMSMGINVRIYKNNISPATVINEKSEVGYNSLTIKWPPLENELPSSSSPLTQMIEIFTLLEVNLFVSKASKKIEAKLLRPSKKSKL